MLRGLVLLGINRRGDFYVRSRQNMVFKRIGARQYYVFEGSIRGICGFFCISMNRNKSLDKLFIFVNFFWAI